MPSLTRRQQTRAMVLLLFFVLTAICVAWALLVQDAVPNACDRTAPPARAQILHCR